MNVVFIIHSRPDVTRRVFETIRAARPEQLFIVADGPKTTSQGEKCNNTRAITEVIDWPCEVQRNYSESNLGCRERIISGLDWVFEHVEEAIILEDDCLPSSSFFSFASELLDRYRNDEQVAYISGQNFAGIPRDVDGDYWLSKYMAIWGWATWRRAWKLFDDDMKSWPSSGQDWAAGYFNRAWVARFWKEIYEKSCKNELNAWGYNWAYSVQRAGMYAVVPRKNMVLNIGFGADSTHTEKMPTYYRDITLNHISFPLHHPVTLTHSTDYDRLYENKCGGDALKAKFRANVFNRYFYGALLCRLPVIGPLWAKWRRAKRDN